LADGKCLLIGMHGVGVFEAACRGAEGFIEADPLTGTASGCQPSSSPARGLERCRRALPGFCARHGIPAATFRQLRARFLADGRFTATVDDSEGRQVTDEYVGSPGRRIQVRAPQGRIRRKRGHVLRTDRMPVSHEAAWPFSGAADGAAFPFASAPCSG
jgi:hypothetical protein